MQKAVQTNQGRTEQHIADNCQMDTRNLHTQKTPAYAIASCLELGQARPWRWSKAGKMVWQQIVNVEGPQGWCEWVVVCNRKKEENAGKATSLGGKRRINFMEPLQLKKQTHTISVRCCVLKTYLHKSFENKHSDQ